MREASGSVAAWLLLAIGACGQPASKDAVVEDTLPDEEGLPPEDSHDLPSCAQPLEPGPPGGWQAVVERADGSCLLTSACDGGRWVTDASYCSETEPSTSGFDREGRRVYEVIHSDVPICQKDGVDEDTITRGTSPTCSGEGHDRAESPGCGRLTLGQIDRLGICAGPQGGTTWTDERVAGATACFGLGTCVLPDGSSLSIAARRTCGGSTYTLYGDDGAWAGSGTAWEGGWGEACVLPAVLPGYDLVGETDDSVEESEVELKAMALAACLTGLRTEPTEACRVASWPPPGGG